MSAREVFPIEFHKAIEASDQHIVAIRTNSLWMLDSLESECVTILNLNASAKVRLKRFRDLADRIAAAVAPHSACQQHCAFCCHIAVTLSKLEADAIGAAIGRRVDFPGLPSEVACKQTEAIRARVNGRPCPFLRAKQCSIYKDRPIACRLHFNLGHSPFFCSTQLSPQDTVVPNVNLQVFWMALGLLTFRHRQGELRDFFPAEASAHC